MTSNKNLIAIGRSRYLYDGIKYLTEKGYDFKAIITDEPYDEYDIKSQDFCELASRIGASCLMVKTIPTDTIANMVESYNIHAAISANWRYTLSNNFLNLFRAGVLNFHLGNLPDYKGNATVNWSIINGEKYIYANIHRMDSELDAGDVISRETIPITSDTYVSDIIYQAEQTAPRLFEKAVSMMMKDPKAYMAKGSSDGLRCYPRLPEDSQINWNQTSDEISKIVRASSHPYQGAYSFIQGEKVIIWRAKPVELPDSILAVPGHVVKLDKSDNSIFVACRNGLMKIQEIEYKGLNLQPAELVKSIRARFKFLPND